MQRGFLEVLRLHRQLCLQLMDLSTVNLLKPAQLMLETIVLDRQILILM